MTYRPPYYLIAYKNGKPRSVSIPGHWPIDYAKAYLRKYGYTLRDTSTDNDSQ